jgi:hypothetical protein
MLGRNAVCSSLLVVCSVLVVALALVACRPAAEVPQSGRVSLEYSSTSERDYLFSLANGTSQPVTFRGWSAMFESTTPSPEVYSSWCYSSQSSSGVLVGPAFVDGGSPPQLIEVSPGEQLRLAIRSDFHQFRGSRCRLSLRLEDGSMVESGDFKP